MGKHRNIGTNSSAPTVMEKAVGSWIADRIKTLRLSKGWSQPRLERESGIGQSTISRIEGGGSLPSLTTVSLLATALGSTLHDVLPPPQWCLKRGREEVIKLRMVQ